ncbi:uncharacterized protein LOC120337522 [Styela clava]
MNLENEGILSNPVTEDEDILMEDACNERQCTPQVGDHTYQNNKKQFVEMKYKRHGSETCVAEWDHIYSQRNKICEIEESRIIVDNVLDALVNDTLITISALHMTKKKLAHKESAIEINSTKHEMENFLHNVCSNQQNINSTKNCKKEVISIDHAYASMEPSKPDFPCKKTHLKMNGKIDTLANYASKTNNTYCVKEIVHNLLNEVSHIVGDKTEESNCKILSNVEKLDVSENLMKIETSTNFSKEDSKNKIPNNTTIKTIIEDLVTNVCTMVNTSNCRKVDNDFEDCGKIKISDIEAGIVSFSTSCHNAEKVGQKHGTQIVMQNGVAAVAKAIDDTHSQEYSDSKFQTPEIIMDMGLNATENETPEIQNVLKVRSKRKSAPVKFAIDSSKKPRILITRKQVRNLPSVVFKTLVEFQNRTQSIASIVPDFNESPQLKNGVTVSVPVLTSSDEIVETLNNHTKESFCIPLFLSDENQQSSNSINRNDEEVSHNMSKISEVNKSKKVDRKRLATSKIASFYCKRWQQVSNRQIIKLSQSAHCTKIIVTVQTSGGVLVPLPNKHLDWDLEIDESFCNFLKKTGVIQHGCTAEDVRNGFNNIGISFLKCRYTFNHIKNNKFLKFYQTKREILLRKNNVVEIIVAENNIEKNELLPLTDDSTLYYKLPNFPRRLKFIRRFGGTFRPIQARKHTSRRNRTVNSLGKRHRTSSSSAQMLKYPETGESENVNNHEKFPSVVPIKENSKTEKAIEEKSQSLKTVHLNPRVLVTDAKFKKVSVGQTSGHTSIIAEEKSSTRNSNKNTPQNRTYKEVSEIRDSLNRLACTPPGKSDQEKALPSLNSTDNVLSIKNPIVLLKRENLCAKPDEAVVLGPTSLNSPTYSKPFASKIMYSDGPIVFNGPALSIPQNEKRLIVQQTRNDEQKQGRTSGMVTKASKKLGKVSSSRNKSILDNKTQSSKLLHKSCTSSSPQKPHKVNAIIKRRPLKIVERIRQDNPVRRTTANKKAMLEIAARGTSVKAVKNVAASIFTTKKHFKMITSRIQKNSAESSCISKADSGNSRFLTTKTAKSLLKSNPKQNSTESFPRNKPRIAENTNVITHAGGSSIQSQMLQKRAMPTFGVRQSYSGTTANKSLDNVQMLCPFQHIPKVSHILSIMEPRATTCCFCHLPANHLLGLGDLFGPYRPLAEELLARQDSINEHQKLNQGGITEDMAHAANGSPEVTIDREEGTCFMTARVEEDCPIVGGNKVEDLTETIKKSSHRLRTISTLEHVLQDSRNASWQKKQKVVQKLGNVALRIPGPKNECKLVPSTNFDAETDSNSQTDGLISNINSIVFLEPKITLPHNKSSIASTQQGTLSSNRRSSQQTSRPSQNSGRKRQTSSNSSFHGDLNESDSTSVCISHKFNLAPLWVHGNCALWADGVYAIRGQLYGLWDAVRTSNQIICSLCHRTGATIVSKEDKLNSRFNGTPLKAYHYPCSISANLKLNWENLTAHRS